MFDNLEGFPKLLVSILLFPLLFQSGFLAFAWGADDTLGIAVAKRALVLLPALGILFSCWVSALCAVSVIFRAERGKFIEKFFVTWWDLSRSLFFYWSGLVRLAFFLIVWAFGLVQLFIAGILVCVQDVFLTPFRMLRGVGEQTVQAGTPWFAAILTLAWCLLESTIFTFVMTPLVIDIFSNMTGTQLSAGGIRVPLFFMLLAFVLGSYAVLQAWVDAVKTRDIAKMVQISIFEIFVLVFEVLFLYREFVDALVPWFAQHAGGDFKLGIFGTLLIAGFVWMGIRAMSWFLFASAGAPTILAVIQRTGLKSSKSTSSGEGKKMVYSSLLVAQVRKELDWISKKGDELLGACILPPLQIVAASVNFCTLLTFARHTFDMPLRETAHFTKSSSLINKVDTLEKS